MPRESVNDLIAFLAVASERSFTRAAAQLGVSQIGLEPYHPAARDEAGRPAADAIDAQRRAY
jgi:hypothetical protein